MSKTIGTEPLTMKTTNQSETRRRGTTSNTLSEQVVRRLHELISTGHYKDGDKLPTNRELGQELGVSILTVQKAMKNLEARGVVECHRRKGTFLIRSQALENPRLRTRLVGMFCPQLFADFHTDALIELEESLSQDGRLLSINFTHSLPEKEITLLRALARQRLEALVYFCSPLVASSSTWSRQVAEWVDRYLHEGTAVIFVDLAPQGMEDRLVSIDNRKAGHMLTRRLLKMGHRSIAYVGTTHLDSGRNRRYGYVKALEEAGLHAREQLTIRVPIIEGSEEELHIPEQVSALLDQHPDITAFVVDNQESAISVRRVLEARPNLGLDPRKSIAAMFEAASPPFEANAWIRIPGQRMGKRAYELLKETQDIMKPPGRQFVEPEFWTG